MSSSAMECQGSAAINVLLHAHSDVVLPSLLSGNDGIFKRDTLGGDATVGDDGTTTIILWQFKLEQAKKDVEWLFRVSTKKNDTGGCILTMSPVVKEEELPQAVLDKLAKARAASVLGSSTSSQADDGSGIQGLMQDAVLTITNLKHGQSSLTLDYAPRAVAKDSLVCPPVNNNKDDSSVAFIREALDGIGYSLTRQHENVSRIEEDRCRCTMGEIDEALGRLTDPREREVMDHALAMLRKEDEDWEYLKITEASKAVRLSQRYKDGDSLMILKAEAVIHVSAKRLLAYLLNFDSFKRTKDHKKSHGTFSSYMHVGGEGGATDARHFFYCVDLGRSRSRRFEVRSVWEKCSAESGRTVYRFAWCPADKNSSGEAAGDLEKIKAECGFKEDNEIPLAWTTGIYELRELAENVTGLTMVRQDDLGGNGSYLTLSDNEAHIVRTTRAAISNLHAEHERRSSVVFRELVAALVETMRKSSGEEQELEEDENGSAEEGGWKIEQSSSPNIRIRTKQQSRGGYSIAMGEAEAVLDCSAEEAAAWFFCFSEREGIVKGENEGNVGHYEISSCANSMGSEKTFVTVKKLPHVLSKRKFITKHAWRVNGRNGMAAVICSPATAENCKEEISEGVTGSASGRFTARNVESDLELKQCRVTYRQSIDAGGSFATYAVNKKLISRLLLPMKQAIEFYRRDEETDNAALVALAEVIKSAPQEYTSEENELLKRGREFLESAEAGSKTGWKSINTYDSDITFRGGAVDGGGIVTGYGTAIVDADVASCLAYEFKKDSREALAARKSKKITDAAIKSTSEHSHLYLNVRDLEVPGLASREFRVKGAWQVEKDGGGAAFLAYEDTNELDGDFPVKAGRVRASIQTAFRFEPLPNTHGCIPQTKVTFACRLDFKGTIPTLVTNAMSRKGFQNLAKLKKRFNKSLEIDFEGRSKIVHCIKAVEGSTTADLCEVANLHMETRVRNAMSGKNGISVSKAEKEGLKAKAKDAVIVRASLEAAAAYMFDYNSRANRKTFGDSNRKIIKRKDDYCMIVRREANILGKFGASLPCEYNSSLELNVIDNDTICLLINPMPEEAMVKPDRSKQRGSVMVSSIRRGSISGLSSSLRGTRKMKLTGKERSTIKLTRLGPMETKIEFVIEVCFNPPLGKDVMTATLESEVRGHKKMTGYFLNLLSADLSTLAGKDGDVLGQFLCADEGATDLKTIIADSDVLRKLVDEFPWFEVLMKEVLKNKLRPIAAPTATNASSLTDHQAFKIGRSLAFSLAMVNKPQNGVDEWVLQHKALQDLEGKYPWIRPLFNRVAIILSASAGWGVKFRVYFAAMLSTLDLFSDVYITYSFHRDQRYHYFSLSLGQLCVSMFFHLLLTWVQNKSRSKKEIAWEILPVLTGVKPAVNAFRVATCAKQKKGQLLDFKMESTAGKCAEMFSEAIPGTIIQLSAIMSQGTFSSAAATSLTISALTTGFTSATLSYDWDNDPVKRAENPNFYGYVPNSSNKRTIVFTCLFLISAGMLLCKATVLILFGLIDANYAYLYLFGDMALYILYKVLRNDFMYWLQVYGPFGAMISTICRVIVKVITDFTSNVHFRHPQEVGGFYWAFNFCLSIVSLPLATVLYARQKESSDDVVYLATNACYTLVMGSAIMTIVFFANIKREYWNTFVSLKTTEDFVCEYFDSDLDSVRKMVFIKNKFKWKKIEGKVERWVRDNWEKWMQEEPDWLDHNIRKNIPAYMIPTVLDKEDEKEQNKIVDVSPPDSGRKSESGPRRRSSKGKISVGKVVPINTSNPPD